MKEKRKVVTISIDKEALNIIDEYIKQEYMTRSMFFTKCALDKIKAQNQK